MEPSDGSILNFTSLGDISVNPSVFFHYQYDIEKDLS